MPRATRRPRPHGFLELQDQAPSRARGLLGSATGAIATASSRLTRLVPVSVPLILARQPRYAAHAAILVVGGALAAGVALQPRPAPTPSVELTLADPPLEMVAISEEPQEIMEPTEAVAEDAVVDAVVAPPARAETPKPRTHTVEEGESLRMLAAKYAVSPETIMAANGISNPDLLKIGQELTILPMSGVLYTLRPGEMLRQVADFFEVPLAEIIAANELGPNPDVVPEGTQLFVPGADPAVLANTNRRVLKPGGEVVAAGVSSAELRSAAPSTRTYEVQPGDTLAGIAQIFGVDVATILSSNGIANPDTIKPGTELRILPVKGIEYEVDPGETLADIAWRYQVDLGLLLDYNNLDNPDVIRVGDKLVLPGGQRRPEAAPPAPVVEAPVAPPVAQTQGSQPAPAAAPKPAAQAPAPAPAPKPAPKPAPAPPTNARGGAAVVQFAMQFQGYPYVFGGTSPRGFDCSGFVFYVHNQTGNPIGRGMWQQFNGGPRVSIDQLQPGDTVFFANTYMPGLSHNGIYIGGGQFVHASDPSVGVVVSSMHSSYWSSRFAGAARLY